MVSNSTSPLDILIWIIVGIVTMFSFLGNGFITIVQGHQWLQNRKILPCDFLLTSLSTSRFLMQLLSSVNYFLYFISLESYMNPIKQAIVYVIWLFFNMVSLWSATWLSVFYCVKITNFANCLFLWLKPRINALVLRLLGISIVISSISSLPSIIEYIGQKKGGNLTGSANHSEAYNHRNMLPLHVTFAFINFTINITATIVLLTSLWKHTRNLKKSGVGGKDFNTKVHFNIIIPLLFYVVFYFVHISSQIIVSNEITIVGSVKQRITDIMVSTFPTVHSIILILTHPKLRETVVRILNIKRRI
ncbi:taste receptor type 2 member 8-like [Anolis carolinensis]|uniref:taste receptor type 2 member 8-like n=1 Tax=Anolis carolinensis TaxID=28377 RepID=UPI0007DB7C2E|nr:PREDICTED: taste receptor type 2 member 8-like [Anolis carolinensis]|eukprot:XP_016852379.1 PREDICTED: taste receptor type 2 member 8-like [Anolis carolinensis]